jgi:hypothetical protein
MQSTWTLLDKAIVSPALRHLLLAYKDGDHVRLVSRNGRDHTRRFADLAAAVAKLSARALISMATSSVVTSLSWRAGAPAGGTIRDTGRAASGRRPRTPRGRWSTRTGPGRPMAWWYGETQARRREPPTALLCR